MKQSVPGLIWSVLILFASALIGSMLIFAAEASISKAVLVGVFTSCLTLALLTVHVLDFPFVDAGRGWLIFALPPAELAAHPVEAPEDDGLHRLYFMCDDVNAEIASLSGKGVKCSEVEEARWGSLTRIHLPGGGRVGLYQPKHPSPIQP